jgi:hypothetical protein
MEVGKERRRLNNNNNKKENEGYAYILMYL